MSIFEVRHTVRHVLDPAAMALLEAIAAGLGSNHQQTQLDRIERKLQLMSDETKVLFKQLDDATNAVAARLTALLALVDNSDVKAALQLEIDRLTAMGADPAAPALT